MSEQPALFDESVGAAAVWCSDCWQAHPPGEHTASPFDRGMAASERAGEKWSDLERGAIDEAIIAAARELERFTADDVWARAPGVRVTKGIAGRLNAARNRKVIASTGEWAVSRRGGDHDHGQRLAVWRSLIHVCDGCGHPFRPEAHRGMFVRGERPFACCPECTHYPIPGGDAS